MFKKNVLNNFNNYSVNFEWHIEHNEITSQLMKFTKAIPESK